MSVIARSLQSALALIATTSACIAQAQPKAVPKAPPLDGFTEFAAIAAAVALAYAALDSFRYPKRVQDHVRTNLDQRNKDRPDLLSQVRAEKQLQRLDAWGILYSLGRYEGKGETIPAYTGNGGLNGIDFLKGRAFFWFNKIYGSNLDKRIAYAFGAIAISFIWFACYDQVFFFDRDPGDVRRDPFLYYIEKFYLALIATSVVYIITHLVCWRWEESKHRTLHKCLDYANGIAVFVFFALVLLITLGLYWPFYSPFALGGIEKRIFIETGVVLWFSIVVMIALLWLGDSLRAIMIQKADACFEKIREMLFDIVEKAKLAPKTKKPGGKTQNKRARGRQRSKR